MQESVNKDRERYLGGSDIPVIMNLSPFKSRFDLLLEKAGYKEDTFEGNVYTEYGNELEPKIREYINSEYLSFIPSDLVNPFVTPFVEGKHIREAENGDPIGVRCHTDGERYLDISGSVWEVLEIKTTSQIFESVDDYKIYLVQLLFYMLNVGAIYGLLAVYERPDDLNTTFNPDRLHLYHIKLEDYKDNLLQEIADAIELFLEDRYGRNEERDQ